MMNQLGVLMLLAVGVVAGWLAGKIMKGKGFGLFGNMIIGVVGAYVGGWLYNFIGLTAGKSVFGTFIMAVIGAIVLLFLIGLIKKD